MEPSIYAVVITYNLWHMTYLCSLPPEVRVLYGQIMRP